MSISAFCSSYSCSVLIETYCNVKIIEHEISSIWDIVLIETYWNVKKETKVIDKSSIKY